MSEVIMDGSDRSGGPLMPADIECFINRGWCPLRGAFDAAAAARARSVVWRRMGEKFGLACDDESNWPPACDIEERLDVPAVLDCFTDRLAAAIGQLVGAGRWIGERRWGFWPVNFRHGRDQPEPWPTWGWHVDGNWFRHTLDSPRQGLLVMGLFSDVPPGSGGTVVAEGTHRRTARVLAAHPEGLHHQDLFARVLARPIGGFREITGSAGDVALCHPWLFHTRGFKRHGGPRFQSNVEAPLKQPLRIAGDPADATVLERSIALALDQDDALPEDARQCRF
jgi:hypothetical protein